MANPSYSDLAGNTQTTLEQIKFALAIIASGMNPDGTANSSSSSGPNSTNSSVTSLGNTTASALALAVNLSRLGATFFNDDTAASVYLKMGTTASSTSFSIKIAPGGYYELPFKYIGRIDVISTVATGSLRITELT